MTSSAVSSIALTPNDIQTGSYNRNIWLSRYSKFLVVCVLGLIFKGALVTSHDAGLAVPDWPSSFGHNMFLFPPEFWIGNIFFEHVHRLIASFVGLVTLVLTIWVAWIEPRKWVRVLTYFALAAVIVQGVLGGLTVIYLLPDAISVAHGVLAQTFFCLTIVIAYSLSSEFHRRSESKVSTKHPELFRAAVIACGAIYLQLILGAMMRHSGSGLAIPDFPTMAGTWWPSFDAAMVNTINEARLKLGLGSVEMYQIMLHFLHRLWAVIVVLAVGAACFRAISLKKSSTEDLALRRAAVYLALAITAQFLLGIYTVLSERQPYFTSLHVLGGALSLGLGVLLALRASSPFATVAQAISPFATRPRPESPFGNSFRDK